MLKFWGDIILNPTPRCYLYAFLSTKLYFPLVKFVFPLSFANIFDGGLIFIWCSQPGKYPLCALVHTRHNLFSSLFYSGDTFQIVPIFQQNLCFLVFFLFFELLLVEGGRVEVLHCRILLPALSSPNVIFLFPLLKSQRCWCNAGPTLPSVNSPSFQVQM